MATSEPPPPESSPNVENEAAQQHRPSVSWKLTSPAASATARKTSGTYPASAAFQRHRLISRPEINLGTQPQICFLQPRTSQPLVLFSLMNSSEAAVTKFLPKSHLSRVIIRDNLSAQRIYELERAGPCRHGQCPGLNQGPAGQEARAAVALGQRLGVAGRTHRQVFLGRHPRAGP
uniref:Uncharacterized protein n=1 Tax=Myotis myotis TaxID=51298 RepID=A0A7J7S0Y9_MYOMY|nr:hypothetical protein mMyoMyo1_001879 [Myotis myotis]